jgi:hypothetical protein
MEVICWSPDELDFLTVFYFRIFRWIAFTWEKLHSRGEAYKRMSSMVIHRCDGLRSETLELVIKGQKRMPLTDMAAKT